MTFTKLSELTGANQAALVTAANPAGIADTVTVTGEHQFTEDNELDYSASFTDGMSAQTITFSELPADTVAIHVDLFLADDGNVPTFIWKRTSGGTLQHIIRGEFADGGTNRIYGTYWLPTGGNSIYPTSVVAATISTFLIIGYKTGA